MSQMSKFSNVDFERVWAFLSYSLNSALREDPELPRELDEKNVIFTIEGPIWSEEFNGWVQSFTSKIPKEALDDSVYVRAVFMNVNIHSNQESEYQETDELIDLVESLGNTPMDFKLVGV